MGKIGNVVRSVHGMLMGRPMNFSWIIDGSLAGSAKREGIEWLKMRGIKAIVSVIEEPLSDEWLDGLEYMHISTHDGNAPDTIDMDRAVDFIHRCIINERPVVVHCAAGKGRTGTILAAYLIKYDGASAKDAIERIRTLRPGSIQTYAQEHALTLYERYVRANKDK